jgi:hypothetical protein
MSFGDRDSWGRCGDEKVTINIPRRAKATDNTPIVVFTGLCMLKKYYSNYFNLVLINFVGKNISNNRYKLFIKYSLQDGLYIVLVKDKFTVAKHQKICEGGGAIQLVLCKIL